MEEAIRNLCRSLSSFCNHIDSSCDALKQSLDRRPIPLGLFYLLSIQPTILQLQPSNIYIYIYSCDRFRLIHLHTMPQSPCIQGHHWSQPARFYDVWDRVFRGALRSLQWGLQEEPVWSFPTPRSPQGLRILSRYNSRSIHVWCLVAEKWLKKKDEWYC